jgi:hypothetical protein
LEKPEIAEFGAGIVKAYAGESAVPAELRVEG